ncbi:acyltransferase family protein [Sphingomonas sp. Y38-1Y]|uniref:acyltransferase family protein n=1 Tax=Sphingomonas sp. Y38-1Y TaxID=3078265 RepID=UPI0028E5564C|nr:acyltransferase family protein [Sphingomonas sp. Y38-1Y]
MSRQHLPGLDFWRALLLLGGLFVHGVMLHPDLVILQMVAFASSGFRMAAFFTIAGYLAERSLRHREPSRWLQARTIRIGIPAVFGVLTISPTIWWLTHDPREIADERARLIFDWHHLWFLYGLMIYQAAAFVIVRHISRRTIRRGLVTIRRQGQTKVSLMLTMLMLVLIAVTTAGVIVLVPAPYAPMSLHLRLIFGYLPLYLFGMALSASPSLCRTMLVDARQPALFLLALAGVYALWRLILTPMIPSGSRPQIEVAIEIIYGAICPAAAVLLVMRSALRIKRHSTLVAKLCAASFTIYVLHYPLIYVAHAIASRVAWSPLLEYGLAVVGVGLIAFAFHGVVVARHPLLALLINGQVLRRRSGGDRRPPDRAPA